MGGHRPRPAATFLMMEVALREGQWVKTKPTYILIELRTAGLDGDNGFVQEAFEAEDDASAIANAVARSEGIPFDLMRSNGSGKKSINIYSHRLTKPPLEQGME